MDLDLRIQIFGFLIEHKILKQISPRILLIKILPDMDFNKQISLSKEPQRMVFICRENHRRSGISLFPESFQSLEGPCRHFSYVDDKRHFYL